MSTDLQSVSGSTENAEIPREDTVPDLFASEPAAERPKVLHSFSIPGTLSALVLQD